MEYKRYLVETHVDVPICPKPRCEGDLVEEPGGWFYDEERRMSFTGMSCKSCGLSVTVPSGEVGGVFTDRIEI